MRPRRSDSHSFPVATTCTRRRSSRGRRFRSMRRPCTTSVWSGTRRSNKSGATPPRAWASRAPRTRSPRTTRVVRTPHRPVRRCSNSRARKWRRAGTRPRRSSAGCPAPIARSVRSRSSGSRHAARLLQPPTADGSRPGAYYINTSDLEERPLHHVASLTYHEANPGHHFQISIEQEMTDRPALRRFGGILAGQRVLRGMGSLQRASRRRDGFVRRRLGTDGDARGAGAAGRTPGHRHRDPLPGLVARTSGDRLSRRSGCPPSTPRSRSTAT